MSPLRPFRGAPLWTALAGAAVLGLAAVPAAAEAPTAPPQPQRSAAVDTYTFAFENADIAQVVQEILGQAGVPYTIDPSINGKISFRIDQRLTREQLLAALEAVLASNNIAMVHNGDQVVITPQTKAKTAAEIRKPSEIRGAGYEVVAVPLGYAQPSEVARAMEAISASDTVLYANDKLGLLLLGGSGPQLKAALETVKVFDQSAFQDSRIRWYELSQAQASTVAQEIERIVQGSGLVGVAVVPLKRLNGVILFGRSKESLDELGKWVTRLDVPGRDPAGTLWVYRPRFTSADNLARTLSGLLGTGGAGGGGYSTPIAPTAPPPSASGPGGLSSPAAAPPPQAMMGPGASGGGTGEDEVRIGVDRETNTLLFFATPQKWVQIQRILNEIDRSARQILIEASIVEVTLGKQFQFGVDWNVFSKNLQVGVVNNDAGKVKALFPGLSATYLSKDIDASLQALGSRTNVEVVSRPKIIALDNHTAHLQVGDQVPVVTQTGQSTLTSNAQVVSNVDYRNTGVILTVTPRIAGDNRLVLDVAQEVSSVAKTSTSGIDSPTIQQRRFESSLIIADGETVALGGLISTNRSDGDAGVPFLKDVPGIGALFRTTSHDNTRSELIVLLSAHILADDAAARKAMDDLSLDMHELQARGLLAAHAKK